MKYLKYPLILLAGILLLFLFCCIFGPKTLNVNESVKINANPRVLYNFLNDLRKNEIWNPWNLQDSTMKVSYGENSAGLGAQSNWTSINSGTGTQKIIESVQNQLIKSELSFEGWDGINTAAFRITPDAAGSHLEWEFISGENLPFFFRGIAFLKGMKKSMKKSYAIGLTNIKRITEERASQNLYNGYTIKEVIHPESHFVVNRQEVNIENVQQYYANNLGSLFAKVQKAGVAMNGMPCGIFFKWDEAKGTSDMAAAIPIEYAISIDGASSFSLPTRSAIVVDHYGDYHNIGQAHTSIDEYMLDKGYLQDPPVIEEYVTDPAKEPDPSKWLTRITYFFTSIIPE